MNVKDLKKISLRYQPIVLPNGKVIKKKCSKTIIDSRKKMDFFDLPGDLTGKTVLDIGCAEGLYLRESIVRGAKKATGVDISPLRVVMNQSVNKLWGFSDKIDVIWGGFMSIEGSFDIVFCLAVLHHFQLNKEGEKMLDTWKMLTDVKYKYILEDHLKHVRKVADLTKDFTIYEYPFTYNGYETKNSDVDFELLGKLWVENGIYKKVIFKGLSQKSDFKDRAIYMAYK